jgi:hypothetical protein
VLLNVSTGEDTSNQVDWVLPNFLSYKPQLDQSLVSMVEELGELANQQANKA